MSDGKFAVLNERNEVVPATIEEWGAFLKDPERGRVAKTAVGDRWISTVFLGMDHSFSDDPEPLWFETMVFTHGKAGYQRRYTTWEQAEAGHREVVGLVERGEIVEDAGEGT